MALSANRNIAHLPDQELRDIPMGVDIIYRDGFVGIDPAGYAKAFEVGDRFVGIAYESVDNSGGSAGDEFCRVYHQGEFEHALTSNAIADHGKAVYATDDETLSLQGHPDAFVGRILHQDADTSGNVIVRLRGPYDMLTTSDKGHIEADLNFNEAFNLTGAASSTAIINNGWECKAILGLGNVQIDGTAALNPAMKLQFDAVAEVALASLRTWPLFSVAGGITFEATMHVEGIGDDAALDIDWGLGSELTTNSEADIDHADMAQLACFHMNGASANILAQSDDATTDVAATDTTIDNVATDAAASFKDFKIIVRPSGSVQFWIDGSRVLSGTTFAVLSTAVLQGWVNVEKTSNDTVCELNICRLRVAGAAVQAIG
jgi:hypothetical protein